MQQNNLICLDSWFKNKIIFGQSGWFHNLLRHNRKTMGHLPSAVCSSCFSYRCFNCGWSSSVLGIQFFIVSRWSKNMWLVRNTGHNAAFIDLYCPLGLWMNDCISRSITLKDDKNGINQKQVLWHVSKHATTFFVRPYFVVLHYFFSWSSLEEMLKARKSLTDFYFKMMSLFYYADL